MGFFDRFKRKPDEDYQSQEIEDKFTALTNVTPKDPGLLKADEFYKKFDAQADFTKALSKQQHKDIEKLSKSSKQLETFTYFLLLLTVILITITGVQVYLQIQSFKIENFQAHVSILGGTPLILDQLNYSNAHLVGHITISSVLPHNSQFLIKSVTFDPVRYDPIYDCQFKNPQVKLENNMTIYLSKDVSNLVDVSIPLIINSTWDIHPYFVNVNSTHPYQLTKMTVYGEITDLQTNQDIIPNIVQSTDVLVHMTHANLCTSDSIADSSKIHESVKAQVLHAH